MCCSIHSGCGGVLRTLRVVGAFPGLGAQRPEGPADSGGGARLSLEESRRKEHQGGRGSSSLDPPFLVGGTLRGSSLFFCLACGPVSYARNGPPTGWAGWGRWFRRREGKHSAKPSPRGEGGPAKPGRMRGRFGIQPFLVEKRWTAVASTRFFYCFVGHVGRPLISHLR